MPNIESFCTQLTRYLTQDQIHIVRRAYHYAELAHHGQFRSSGEPYVTHPLAVAGILAQMHMDHESLAAAMLHDVIEDTGVQKVHLVERFGQTISDLVDGVSKLTSMHFENRAIRQAENFQKMALAMAEDIRVILIKLADRLHNMRTLGALAPEKRRRIARETLEIYAPIANRLGMHDMCIELEDLGFAAFYPLRIALIQSAVKKSFNSHAELIRRVEESLKKRLHDEQLPVCVISKEKHLYSVYQTMLAQKKSFSEIVDVFTFCIITQSVDDSYRSLGKIHSLFKPIHGGFKDYIAIPKANGYQSLHTVLFGLQGIPVNVQIRTQQMDDMASHGIATRWLYKQSPVTYREDRTRHWLHRMLEIQQQAGNPLEFIENVKADLFPDEIYVFTPKGHIMELPKGATPIDFAYAVHTDVGHTCVACKINRRLASLSQTLESGQTVEIITASGASPNIAWLGFASTGKARANIRHYLKHQKKTESIALGRRLLSRALGMSGKTLEQLNDQHIQPVLQHAGLENFDDLLDEIGLGNRVAYIVAQRLLTTYNTETLPELSQKIGQSITITGTEGVVIHFGHCCYPIPGDPILGRVNVGKGIVVHRATCHNVLDTSARHQIMAVQWDEQVKGDFLVPIRIELEPKRGSIAAIATLITEAEASIEKIAIKERDERFSIAELLIGVHNRKHLANLIKRLRIMPDISRIVRNSM